MIDIASEDMLRLVETQFGPLDAIDIRSLYASFVDILSVPKQHSVDAMRKLMQSAKQPKESIDVYLLRYNDYSTLMSLWGRPISSYELRDLILQGLKATGGPYQDMNFITKSITKSTDSQSN